jgi:hypothetical protein
LHKAGIGVTSLTVLSILLIGTSVHLRSTVTAQEQGFNEKTIEVQIGNKTYPLSYDTTNGTSIINITAPFSPSLKVTVDAPSDGLLSLTFPRELYDALSFTDHEVVVFVDEIPVDFQMLAQNCSDTELRFPIGAGSEEIEIVYSDILGSHTHPFPPRLDLIKRITVQEGQFSVRIVTDALRCDVSFMKEEKKIHVDIRGRDEFSDIGEGHFRLTVPHGLLGGNYTVLVDGEQTNFTENQFFTKNYTDIVVESAIQDDFTPIKASHISFNYSKDATSIDVIGTTAIPEFSSSFVVATAAVAAIATLFVISGRYRIGKRN